MSTTSAKTLSPSELAKLEHAFATDPASDAYKPLAEAYLGMGRFMEAMVVCKKGVKAHPTSADPRLLLARVYAEQGKDKKALEELTSALQVAPSDKQLLRMAGNLQLKTGETDAGKANLIKAFEADPNDADTKALMAQWKVEAPKPAAPEPPTERNPIPAAASAGATPIAGPGARREPVTGARPAAAGSPPVLTPVADAPPGPSGNQAVAQAPANNAVSQAPASRPSTGRSVGNGVPAIRPSGEKMAPGASGERRAPPRTVSRPSVPIRSEEDDEAEERSERKQRAARSKGTRSVFIALVALLPLTLGGYYGIGQYRARKNREIKKALAEATEQLKHDSYESYKKACTAADKALEIDPDSVSAHAYLAYAWAVRWGEHGGGDAARKNAEEHLEAAIRSHEDSSYMYAAQALLKKYAGKGTQAQKELEEKVKAFDAEGKQSSLMYLTLGLIQMDAGDLERSKDSLEKAQEISPDDPRVYSALGALYQRRGQDQAAWKNYDFALRYEKDHHEAMLGKALLMVMQENDNPDFYIVASKMLKKLIDADPPPSPKQLAAAHLVRALLISRVSMDMPRYKPEFQQELSNGTGVPMDKQKAQTEITKSEDTGFTLDRSDPDLKLIKARRLAYEGNYDAAVTEIRSAISADPMRAQFYMELARVLMKKPGGSKDARDALVTAIRTMGESPKLQTLLGHAYLKSDQVDEALAQFQRAVSDPKAKNPEARLGLGIVYRLKKDYPNSITALDKAALEFVGQSAKVAEVKTELGRTYEEKGDRAKADEAYQAALKAEAGYGPAYYWYARFLSATDKGKAKLTAAEYLRLEPKGEFVADAQRLTQ